MQDLRILLAEDNMVNQMIMLSMLNQLGVTVDVAANGQEAVAKFEANAYAMIFMDCQMPVMDGHEASLKIRALETERGGPATPIVALTAATEEADKNKCRQSGMTAFLPKPVSLEAVRAVLAEQTGRSQ